MAATLHKTAAPTSAPVNILAQPDLVALISRREELTHEWVQAALTTKTAKAQQAEVRRETEERLAAARREVEAASHAQGRIEDALFQTDRTIREMLLTEAEQEQKVAAAPPPEAKTDDETDNEAED